MPWTTPTLRDVRSLVRDAVHASLPGADANVPNSLLRVMSDNQGALCHLTLQYVDWLSLQLLPDTAETEWLDRHGQIWLVNADGTTGRKMASLATGVASFQGLVDGTVIPAGTQLQSAADMPAGSTSANPVVTFETLADVVTSSSTHGRRLDPRARSWRVRQPAGRHHPGDRAADRRRELGSDRAQPHRRYRHRDRRAAARPHPAAHSEPADGRLGRPTTWPGRWRCPASRARGPRPSKAPGTITVRFLMDDLRADDDGWPTPADVEAVALYIDQKRPVTVMGCYVLAPIKQFIDITIANLVPDTPEAQAEIEASIQAMLFEMAAPGQTIFAAWVSLRDHECAERAVVSAGDDRRLRDAVARPHGRARRRSSTHERSAHPAQRLGLHRGVPLAAAARAGLAEARARQRAGADHRQACATTGASSTAAPPICWSAKATRA